MTKILLLTILAPIMAMPQGYTSYFIGSATNITTQTTPGTCMMGGATEHDNAMIWLLEKANGGDVVVLRSSGSDGYNDYLYSELGVNVNSVETLVITSAEGATSPYVLDKVANAEMLWFAGGDQWNYVQYFRNNALEDLINNHVNVKNAPIGGTSAGMAILGSVYFTAQNGTITSQQALNDPYHPNMALGANDFLDVPYLHRVITDTHYDNPDRRGRHVAFMANMIDYLLLMDIKGIACNEYVAVCIDGNGKASVYGEYPEYDEFAYFIKPNCEYYDFGYLDTCEAGTPLTWSQQSDAIKVYKVPGTMEGTHYFDLNMWEDGNMSGGTWEHWTVINGELVVTDGTPAEFCVLDTPVFSEKNLAAYPNPFTDHIALGTDSAAVEIYDMAGKKVFSDAGYNGGMIATSGFAPGLYLVTIEENGKTTTKKMIKR